MAQVDYCFACWPGGPVTPPPCLRCGSRTNYAWGVGRLHDWLCAGCNSGRREHATIAACRICSNVLTLGQGRVCRLCRKQATLMRGDKELLDLAGANAHGQQLFFADMFYVSARDRAKPLRPETTAVEVRPTARATVYHV